MRVAEDIWAIVMKWGFFERDTLGKQWVKAADSIAANLSEGLGRYHYKEAKNFSYFARGSLFETKTWLAKAFARKLTSQEEFTDLSGRLDAIGRMLNGYINSIGQVGEPEETYETNETKLEFLKKESSPNN